MSKLRYKREFTDGLTQEDFDEEISEMAHLQSCYSRLPYIVMIDHDGIKRKRENNSPRIMISLDNHLREIIPVSIDKDSPEILIKLNKVVSDLNLVFDWIKKHYDILMKHWNREISDFKALDLLSK